MKRKRIASIRLEGYPALVPMIDSEYIYIRRQLLIDYPHINIPKKEDMLLNGDTLWYININPFKLHIEYSSGKMMVISFEVGFPTDNGSIPSFAQGWIKNNDPNCILAFFAHDLVYQTKEFGINRKGFKMANRLLRDICDYYKKDWVKHSVIESAVNSHFGWSNYKKRFERDRIPYGTVSIIKKGE